MSRFLDAALRLARMGFRVFPLIPGDKIPAVSRFPIVATTDEKQLRAWWSNRPDCNIGVSTSGFVVVDVDTKKGSFALDNFYAMGGHFETFSVQTATGGYHCYYNGPDSKLVAGLVPGIDIRSHGGYVVGPGSVTSSTHEGCVDGEYTLIKNVPLQYVPIPFEIALEPPGVARERNDNAVRDEPYNITNGKTWLQTAEPAVEGKGGNTLTFTVCAKLVRDFALTPETAYQLLISHYNERCIPPWSSGELWRLVQNADAYGTSDLGAKSPDKTFGSVVVPEQPSVAPVEYKPTGVYMGNAIAPATQVARPWCVERMLMRGELTLLGGIGSAGKSMLQLTAAAHFAQGLDFGSFKLRVPNMPLRSIVYNGEDDAMEASRRLFSICTAYNFDYNIVTQNIALMDDRQGELTLAAHSKGVPIINQDAIKFLRETMGDNRADIMMYDPLVNLHGLVEMDNSHMRLLASLIRNIARETNSAAMVSHHTSKSSSTKEKGDADAFRGASALVNSSRIALLISGITKGDREQFGLRERSAKDYIRIDTGKANMFKKDGEALAWLKWETVRHIAGDFIGVPKIVNLKNNQADQDKELGVIVRDAMVSAGTGSFTRTDAAKAIKSSAHITATLSESSLRNLVENMFENPLVVGEDTLQLVTEGGKDLIKLV
jgi:RecA-family ATPase